MTPLHQTLIHMLPYELKVQHISGMIFTISGINLLENILHNKNLKNTPLDLSACKPILFSLDMLDKEIEQDGRKFVPAEDLSLPKLWWKIAEGGFAMIGEGNDGEVIAPGLMTYNRLYEWHFNVFGLEEGQFIPVTKEFNPYK